MRRPGFRDAMIALKLYELRREPDLRTSRDLLRTYWELAASFVNRGLLHPDVYLDACDEGLLLYAALEEHLPRIRKVRPRFASQTEAVLRDHPVVRGRVLELRSEVFKRRKEEGK